MEEGVSVAVVGSDANRGRVRRQKVRRLKKKVREADRGHVESRLVARGVIPGSSSEEVFGEEGQRSITATSNRSTTPQNRRIYQMEGCITIKK